MKSQKNYALDIRLRHGRNHPDQCCSHSNADIEGGRHEGIARDGGICSPWLHRGDGQAAAQTWPTKPIKAIVPIAAGSLTDIVPRIVFEQLSTQLGQNIVVENRPGAGQTTGVTFVAKSDPDGYTLLANSSAQTIAPAFYPNLSYDPGRDLAAVATLGVSPFVLVVSPNRGSRRSATSSPPPRRSRARSTSPRPASEAHRT